MATTSSNLANEPGNRVCAVLLIEGFPYIITDHGAMDAVFVAWEESDWGEGSILGELPGLKIHGHLSDRFEPYNDTINANRLTFVIQPDEDEILAKAIFKTKPSFETRLADVFEPAADGSGVLSVKQTTDAPASGTMYIGGKRMTYSAKGASSLTVTTANAYTPFQGNGANKFSPGHSVAPGDFWDASHPSKVQDVPRTWIGKRVALYLHTVTGGVLDTPMLEFAGSIKAISETAEGETVLECEDLRGVIRDTVLHKNQWAGFVQEGIHLVTGMEFRAEQVSGITPTSQSNRLAVVSGTPAGSYEIQAGRYEIHEFVQLIDKWLHNDSNLDAVSNGWYAKVNGDLRFEVGAEFASTDNHEIRFYSNDPFVFRALGFDPDVAERTDNNWYRATGSRKGTNAAAVSPGPPMRIMAIQHGSHKGAMDTGYTINIVGNRGEWFDHSAYLPSTMADWANGENYSVLEIGGQLFFGKYASATQLTDVLVLGRHGWGAAAMYRTGSPGLTIEDPSDHFEVKQVVTLAGSLQNLIPKLLASVQGLGTNHATHDVLPFGAGIPWSLLGDGFTDSLASLNDTDDQGGMVVRLEKPTKLLDVLMPELAMRFAFIVWKDEGYRFVTPPTPNAVNADHTLDETNKAGPMGAELRSSSHISQEWLRNVIKVEYNRGPDGKYRDTVYVKKQASIDDYGESQPVTIKASNSFDDEVQSGASVQDALARLDSILEFWAKPLKVVRRSIPPTLYHIAPGDTVSLSDDFVRDPTTGARGLSGRGGVVLAVTHDWGSDGGSLFGEVEILLSDEDRTYPFSPAADVDHTYTAGTFTAGYSDSTLQLKLKQHSFSRSTDDKDVTHFDPGDKIRIVQIDPTNPASVTAWDRTVATSGVDTTNDILTLTATLSSPAFDSALRYRIVPQLYTSVQASQKLHSFIADDADGLILDAAQPTQFGEFTVRGYTESALTVLPSLIPTEMDDQGYGVHPGLLYDFGTMANNMINYGAAFSAPMMFTTSPTTTSTSYKCTLIFPVWCGGSFPPGKTRYIKCAPRMRTTGGTGYCRVTASRLPPRGESLTGVKWYGARNHKEFTTTSTTSIEVTAQNLRVIRGDNPGITWITVELKATSGQTTTFNGLGRFYLGPLESL